MKAILKEEKKIEDFKNQSYDIEKLGIAGEIFCTKSLVISTGLQKGKVKALLQAAKEVEISNDNFVRNDAENDFFFMTVRIARSCLYVCTFFLSYQLLLCSCVRFSTDYYAIMCICVRSKRCTRAWPFLYVYVLKIIILYSCVIILFLYLIFLFFSTGSAGRK